MSILANCIKLYKIIQQKLCVKHIAINIQTMPQTHCTINIIFNNNVVYLIIV